MGTEKSFTYADAGVDIDAGNALVDRINALHPDLVVCTGDLISRYDPQKRARNDTRRLVQCRAHC